MSVRRHPEAFFAKRFTPRNPLAGKETGAPVNPIRATAPCTAVSEAGKAEGRGNPWSPGELADPSRPGSPVGIGGVAEAIAHEVETEDGEDDGDDGGHEPGVFGDGFDVEAVLEQHAPAHERGT